MRTVELEELLSKPNSTLKLVSPPFERSTDTDEIRLRFAEMTFVTEPGTHVRFLAGVTNGLSGSEGSFSIKYMCQNKREPLLSYNDDCLKTRR